MSLFLPLKLSRPPPPSIRSLHASSYLAWRPTHPLLTRYFTSLLPTLVNSKQHLFRDIVHNTLRNLNSSVQEQNTATSKHAVDIFHSHPPPLESTHLSLDPIDSLLQFFRTDTSIHLLVSTNHEPLDCDVHQISPCLTELQILLTKVLGPLSSVESRLGRAISPCTHFQSKAISNLVNGTNTPRFDATSTTDL